MSNNHHPLDVHDHQTMVVVAVNHLRTMTGMFHKIMAEIWAGMGSKVGMAGLVVLVIVLLRHLEATIATATDLVRLTTIAVAVAMVAIVRLARLQGGTTMMIYRFQDGQRMRFRMSRSWSWILLIGTSSPGLRTHSPPVVYVLTS